MTASRALATLRGATKLLPDPTMLVNLIPLLEARASSEIENIVTTNDEVFRAAHKATKWPHRAANPLSGHILRHKNEYYRLLSGVTQREEWEPWILFTRPYLRITGVGQQCFIA
ncbi:Fic/DOC family N-terminal domain-containing protein [Trueperella pyogenes]|uniref:Fic/DOC family N-terminal domain-containing protein n=1 Tax=Trueperella pyogenes TaxID=1661 RepID=UPI00324EF832